MAETQNWTPKAVREGKTEPNNNGPGNLTKFYVDFVGEDLTESPDTYWRQKEGNTPKVGEPVYGTISEGKFGPIFKLEKKDGGSFQGGGGGQRSAAKDAYWEAKEQRDIEGIARMGRAHAQEMALTAIRLYEDTSGAKASWTPDGFKQEIAQWTEWFQQDVDASAPTQATPSGNVVDGQSPAEGEREGRDSAATGFVSDKQEAHFRRLLKAAFAQLWSRDRRHRRNVEPRSIGWKEPATSKTGEAS